MIKAPLRFRLHYFLLYYFVYASSMELTGSLQDGATRPVTGPPLQRSPEVLGLQDPVAETRGGSLVANRAWAKAGVPTPILTPWPPAIDVNNIVLSRLLCER